MNKNRITYDNPIYKKCLERAERLINSEFISNQLNVMEKCTHKTLYEYIETPLTVKNHEKNPTDASFDDADSWSEEYPMWSWIFTSRNEFMQQKILDNIDEIQSLGFGIIHEIDLEDGIHFHTSLFFKGCGYDFYEAHWIPLFDLFGWFGAIRKDNE